MAFIIMAYIAMAYTMMAYMTVAYTMMAYTVMACIVLAYRRPKGLMRKCGPSDSASLPGTLAITNMLS